MFAFLIITSLSVAFYLGLLVVLHRDGRKRRVNRNIVRKVELGTAAELSASGFVPSASPAVLIYPRETSRRRTRQPRVTAGEPAQVVTLHNLASRKSDLQCG